MADEKSKKTAGTVAPTAAEPAASPEVIAALAVDPLDQEHPEYPGLTYRDVERAKAKAAKKVAEERKAATLTRIEEQELINLRDAMGETERQMHEIANLSPSNREMVEITLALPIQIGEIRLDGQIYHDRGTYTVTRAKAQEMLKIQYEGWRHEAIRRGDDSYAFYAQMNQQNRSVVTRGGLLSSLVLNGQGGVVSGRVPTGTH